MIERKKICITVKTYPTLSKKYDELVCTAGLLDDGSWIRIYPLPFRKLDYDKKYKKYHWIEADVERNLSDIRPESYKVFNIDTSRILERNGDEKAALNKVRLKCLNHFVSKRDLYFFLGTTKLYHGWALNPFIIVGLYYPPRINKPELDFQ